MICIYNSVFHQELMDFENMRLKSGYSQSALYSVRLFDRFLVENNYNEKYISKDIMDLWAVQKETENKNTRNGRVSDIKQFCLYLNAIGIDAYIPSYHFSYEKSYPYVLTEEELTSLFDEIDKLFAVKIKHKSQSRHYSFMFPVLMRLLYTTGLRNNEAVSLTLGDVNSDATLTIHNAKNSKDRLVYLSDEMFRLLMDYLSERDKYIISDWLFPSSSPDKHIHKTTVDNYFYRAVINSNIGTQTHHPTPHSLRHTYVVHLVDQWVRNSNDVDELMPYLSKQLGHETIEETYYYYHMISSSYKAIEEKNRDLFPEVPKYEEE